MLEVKTSQTFELAANQFIRPPLTVLLQVLVSMQIININKAIIAFYFYDNWNREVKRVGTIKCELRPELDIITYFKPLLCHRYKDFMTEYLKCVDPNPDPQAIEQGMKLFEGERSNHLPIN